MTQAWEVGAERLASGSNTPPFPAARGLTGEAARRNGSLADRAEPATLSVLLVDDDEVDAKYISWLLGCIDRYTFDIVHVTSSEAALAANAGRRFDLYLVDFWLMHETSIPLISELGQMHSRAPIVVLTNLNSGDIEDLGLRAGALGFLSKGNLSETALELVISSALFTRQVETELKEEIARLQAQRDNALAASSHGLLAALGDLDEAHRSAAEAKDGSACEHVAARLAAARRHVLDALVLGEGEAVEPTPDLRTAMRQAVDAYTYEAGLRGVTLSCDLPEEQARPAGDPRMLSGLLVGMLDAVASQRKPADLSVAAEIAPRHAVVSVRPAGAATPSDGDGPAALPRLQALAQGLGATLEDTGDGGLSVMLPLRGAD